MQRKTGVVHGAENGRGGDPFRHDAVPYGGRPELAIAVAQEVAKPDRDWTLIATMAAGLLVGIGGGAYGRINNQGPISSIPPK